MSDNKNLGQKVTDEFHRFAKNSPDFKKEIEDMMNSVGEETDSLMKRAKDKIVEFYQESKKHSKPGSARICFWNISHHPILWSNENDDLLNVHV